MLYSTLHCKKKNQKKVGEGYRQQISVRIKNKGHSCTVGGSVKYKMEWFNPFGKSLAVSCNKIHAKPHDPEIPLLVVYPRK